MEPKKLGVFLSGCPLHNKTSLFRASFHLPFNVYLALSSDLHLPLLLATKFSLDFLQLLYQSYFIFLLPLELEKFA